MLLLEKKVNRFIKERISYPGPKAIRDTVCTFITLKCFG